MDQQYFGVSLEKLLTSGGQTLYMVAWSLIIGTIIGMVGVGRCIAGFNYLFHHRMMLAIGRHRIHASLQ